MTKIIIKRRIALSVKYEFYELKAEYDPAETQGDDVIEDIERTVAFIRTVTQTLEPALEEIKTDLEETKAERSDPNTRIKDLKSGDKKVDIVVRLVSVQKPQTFEKKDGSEGMFLKGKIADSEDSMAITVWDAHIKTLTDLKSIQDDTWLTIQGGYVNDYQGKLELNVGQWARMDIMARMHSEEDVEL